MVAAVGTQVSQLSVVAAAIFPSVSLELSQMSVLVAADMGPDMQVSQLSVLVAARGRIANPRVRAWTFTLDGKDFYVLRLGDRETLVYEVSAQQWYVWGSDLADLWRAITGKNWFGGRALAAAYGSNILVGDDSNGALYFLDPEGVADDDALLGADLPREFVREITGQVATRSIDSVPCFGVQLIGSIGEQPEGTITTVMLSTSDDQGNTYDEHDTLTVEVGEHTARLEWRSLGSFEAPGRLFKITDYGALHRIDYLEMLETDDD